MQQAITIDELIQVLVKENKKGNGGKHILISTDDEGNGYHELFFGVTPITDQFMGTDFSGVDFETAKKDYIILG
jgi:hypothetical protein